MAIAPDGLLSRFAGDIDNLTQYGTNLKDGALGKALIDVAIADYYFMQNGFTKDFYNAIIGQYLNGDQTARAFLAQDNIWSILSIVDPCFKTGVHYSLRHAGAGRSAEIGNEKIYT
ncbi:MAG: hypothetical protein ACYCY5_08185 [Sulfuricella sp.]